MEHLVEVFVGLKVTVDGFSRRSLVTIVAFKMLKAYISPCISVFVGHNGSW